MIEVTIKDSQKNIVYLTQSYRKHEYFKFSEVEDFIDIDIFLELWSLLRAINISIFH